MSYTKYLEGQRYGPYNILLLKHLPKCRGIWQCPFCEKTFEANNNKVKTGNTTRCKDCTKQRRSELGKSKSKNLTGQKCGFLEALYPTDKRQGSYVVWKALCHKCGEETEISSGNWGRNQQCNKCAHEKDLTNQRSGKLLALYKTGEKKNGYNIWCCLCDCGNLTTLSVGDWGKTQSCGKCYCSHGENKIQQWLDNQNIKYNFNYTNHNCINPQTNRKLRFDFYLSDYNIIIEYDGQQHFQESSMCSDSLKERQYRDNIKNQYCLDNNIKLIRIPYTNYDKIEQILNELITGHFKED